MNAPIHHRTKKGDEGISFPHLQCWNPITKVATIAAQVSGRRVSCRLKIDDLGKRFQILPDEPMKSVTNYRTEIETAIRKLVENNNFEDDGSIIIGYQDL